MAHAATDPRATDRPPHKIDRLLRYLEKLSNDGFFGKVVVSFQHGKVCDVKIEQSKRMEDL
ncbi:MAG TPA: hypothetical protein VM734_12745 [Kofleriaceae bacterium]|jgi:hypothetical protein|nr:hypothetical protein [Kofleriaceae bacterium]